jgi:hypothetical protein
LLQRRVFIAAVLIHDRRESRQIGTGQGFGDSLMEFRDAAFVDDSI